MCLIHCEGRSACIDFSIDGLKQQSVIIVYRLQTKVNKLLSSISVCSEQTEVCGFFFPFAANKRKMPFFVSSVFHIYIYIYIWKTELYVYIFAAVSNGKRMPRQMFSVLTDVCHLSVFYEETNGNYLLAN